MSHSHKHTHNRRPITSADMIRRAHEAEHARAGVRVKVRFPDELARRARECANDIGDGLGDWVNKACRQYRAGMFASVAQPAQTELATREKSECITVRAPDGMPADEIKQAVAACVARCEARRIPCTPQHCPRYRLDRFSRS
jgi:hypothetical protein